MQILSRPRPNGSRAERETSQALQAWLRAQQIPFRVHTFRQLPFFFESIGAWLLLSRLLLALAIWLKWGWLALPVALVGLVGATVDQAFHWPTVTWLGARRGENILIEFGPAQAEREVIFSAHYDSKTELLDHQQRMLFLKSVPLGILLTLTLGILGPLEAWLRAQGAPQAGLAYWTGVGLSLVILFLAGGMGLNMLLGRLASPSQGAVDNGSACAILLGLAKELKHEMDLTQPQPGQPCWMEQTRVTLILFSGEEIDRQGSRAYARDRSQRPGGWPRQVAAVNMEVMAQDGDYVLWEEDGSIFRRQPLSVPLRKALRAAVQAVTGQAPIDGGPVLSDGAPFLWQGLHTAVLGTYDRRLKDTGFHSPKDNLQRVVMQRLPEGAAILRNLLERLCRDFP